MIDTTQGNILKGWKIKKNWQNRLSQWAPESKNKLSSWTAFIKCFAKTERLPNLCSDNVFARRYVWRQGKSYFLWIQKISSDKINYMQLKKSDFFNQK